MRCLFAHKWIVKASELRLAVPYRTCEHCGTIQRGIYDPFWRDIEWETIRERAFSESADINVVSEPSYQWDTAVENARILPEQIGFIRKRSSRLNQWAHSLRLRRSRASDNAD